MSKKFYSFKKALIDLCKAHKVQLSVSMYDAMQVWNLKKGEEPIYSNGFEDMTRIEKAKSIKDIPD